jgi:SH3-like domain-containing protein
MRPIFIVHSRGVQLALAVVLVSSAASARAADSLPYTARVVAPGAAVHSGPGDNFYPTDTLAQGDEVEVHRERPDGWLGIRPPDGSFSWVFGLHVKLLEDGLAEINKDDAASRIGSRLGDQRNAVQVRLKKGETVEIIGEETVDGKKWYKVAPPSGEFRWIHTTNVERVNVTPPAVAQPIVTVPLPEARPEPRSAIEHSEAGVALVSGTQPQAGTDWRAAPVDPNKDEAKPTPAESADAVATSPVETPKTPSDDSAAANAASPTSTVTPAIAGPAAAATTSAPSVQSVAPLTASNDPSRQLTEIELRLSRIVAEPPVTWQIEPLRQESLQLLAGASDQANRAAIGATLAKLDRFAAIARQYQPRAQAAASASQAPITPIPYGAVSGDPRTTGFVGSRDPTAGVAGSRVPVTANSSQYDAVGILRPVVSKRPGAPQFALVDERGQVISFVTPTPDVNLQPYLGHRIGVTGSRGYIPEFQRAHVTAGRVSPLGARIMR